MKLAKILENTGAFCERDVEISDILYDTRTFDEGDRFDDKVFVCISGFVFDGHNYVNQAYAKGIRVFAVEKPVELPSDAIIICVQSTRIFLAVASANLFDNPAKKMKMIGVTGTKGKTSTTFLIRSVLEQSGAKVGLMNTLGVFIGDFTAQTGHSTAESYVIHKYLAMMVEYGCDTAVMETSSQGFKLHRTYGILFDIGVFTNISNDHISDNEHSDFDDYVNCKSMLFKQCRAGVINADDACFDKITEKAVCEVYSYGLQTKCDYYAENIDFCNDKSGLYTAFRLSLDGKKQDIRLPLLGEVFVYNALCAATVASVLGISNDCIKKGLESTSVKGRGEVLPINKDFYVVIDFAHNEVSTNSIFRTLKPYKTARIITVFGCGGNRVRERRYVMGDVITRHSEVAIITSDNPRFEKLDDIIEDIYKGITSPLGEVLTIKDRRAAIYHALDIAQAGDIVLIVGKGHQDYEEIEGKFYNFNEPKIVMEYLNGLE